jgi:hypothetical protein
MHAAGQLAGAASIAWLEKGHQFEALLAPSRLPDPARGTPSRAGRIAPENLDELHRSIKDRYSPGRKDPHVGQAF